MPRFYAFLIAVFLLSKISAQNSACNFAGTIEAAQFIGQSNDWDLDTIYLCLGDSVLIDHQGDAELSGDPQPVTAAGVGYIFYHCPPVISGSTLQDILQDPCLLEGSASGIFITQGIPNGGDTWFFNDGTLQNIFNLGQPVAIQYAPVTIDDYVSNNYESAQVGLPPGPCVNVNKLEAFEVVYLNPIAATGRTNHFGDDCIGRFTVSGGLPQFDFTQVYSINISLLSDPSIKAQLMTPPSNFFDHAAVPFTVCTPGIYQINIEDGKSCGLQFTMNMGGCDASDNLYFDFDEVAGLPGEQICVPLRVKNFDIVSGSFSVSWNPANLEFIALDHLNPAVSSFFDPNNFANTLLSSTGNIGIALYNPEVLGGQITIPDDEALFDLCFKVLDTTTTNCLPMEITNRVAGTFMEDSLGKNFGLCLSPGSVCKPVSATHSARVWNSAIFPNPVQAGENCSIYLNAAKKVKAQWTLHDGHGSLIQSKILELNTGENRISVPTQALSAGIYFIRINTEDALGLSFKVIVL